MASRGAGPTNAMVKVGMLEPVASGIAIQTDGLEKAVSQIRKRSSGASTGKGWKADGDISAYRLNVYFSGPSTKVVGCGPGAFVLLLLVMAVVVATWLRAKSRTATRSESGKSSVVQSLGVESHPTTRNGRGKPSRLSCGHFVGADSMIIE